MKVIKKLSILALSVCLLSFNVLPIYAQDTSEFSIEEEIDKQITLELKEELENVTPMDPNEIELLVDLNAYMTENNIGNFSELTDEDISNFIDQEYINLNLNARGIGKEAVRASFAAIVACGYAAGCTLSAELLSNSLQDYPSSVSYEAGCARSLELHNSSTYNDVIRDFKDALDSLPSSKQYHSTYGSFKLDDDLDLYMGINYADYLIAAEKVNGRWQIYMRVDDIYDFDHKAWEEVTSPTTAAGVALNNYGDYAESIGAIVPFDVYMYNQYRY